MYTAAISASVPSTYIDAKSASVQCTQPLLARVSRAQTGTTKSASVRSTDKDEKKRHTRANSEAVYTAHSRLLGGCALQRHGDS